MRICVHRHSNVGMSHQILQCFGIHSGFRLVAAVSVPANVRRNLRKLHPKNAVVSVHRILKPMLPMKCYLRHSILISEKESHITIHHNLRKIRWPVFQNCLEHSEHVLRHWKLSCTGICFRGFDVILHAANSLKLMVDIDNAVL